MAFVHSWILFIFYFGNNLQLMSSRLVVTAISSAPVNQLKLSTAIIVWLTWIEKKKHKSQKKNMKLKETKIESRQRQLSVINDSWEIEGSQRQNKRRDANNGRVAPGAPSVGQSPYYDPKQGQSVSKPRRIRRKGGGEEKSIKFIQAE